MNNCQIQILFVLLVLLGTFLHQAADAFQLKGGRRSVRTGHSHKFSKSNLNYEPYQMRSAPTQSIEEQIIRDTTPVVKSIKSLAIPVLLLASVFNNFVPISSAAVGEGKHWLRCCSLLANFTVISCSYRQHLNVISGDLPIGSMAFSKLLKYQVCLTVSHWKEKIRNHYF